MIKNLIYLSSALLAIGLIWMVIAEPVFEAPAEIKIDKILANFTADFSEKLCQPPTPKMAICVRRFKDSLGKQDLLSVELRKISERALIRHQGKKCWLITACDKDTVDRIKVQDSDFYGERPEYGKFKASFFDLEGVYNTYQSNKNIGLNIELLDLEEKEKIYISEIMIPKTLLPPELLGMQRTFFGTISGLIKRIKILGDQFSIHIFRAVITLAVVLAILIPVDRRIFIRDRIVRFQNRRQERIHRKKVEKREKGREARKIPIIGVRASGKTHFIVSVCEKVAAFKFGTVTGDTLEQYAQLTGYINRGEVIPATMSNSRIEVKIDKVKNAEGKIINCNMLLSTEDISGIAFEEAVRRIYETPNAADDSVQELKKLLCNSDAILVLVDLVRDAGRNLSKNDELKIRRNWGNQLETLFIAIRRAIETVSQPKLKLIYLVFTKTDYIDDHEKLCTKIINIELVTLRSFLTEKRIDLQVAYSQSRPFVPTDDVNFEWIKDMLYQIVESIYLKSPQS